jgi:hypothetical protein
MKATMRIADANASERGNCTGKPFIKADVVGRALRIAHGGGRERVLAGADVEGRC